MRLKILLVTASLSGYLGQPALSRNDIVNSLPPAAFVDVTVVPMDSERVLEHQTVVVRNGRIAEIGPVSRIPAPRGGISIDGRARYLMPGLADMHAHPEKDSLELVTFVANGVTMVRTMHGTPDQLRWRAEAAAGRLVSPTIYASGPLLDGVPPQYQEVPPVASPAEAIRAVRAQHAAGYDFIKVYNTLSKDIYEAILSEARGLGLPVAGHVPFPVGLRGALASRQSSIEHLRGYVAELVPNDAPVQPGTDLRSRTLAWNYADESRFP